MYENEAKIALIFSFGVCLYIVSGFVGGFIKGRKYIAYRNGGAQ